MDRTFDFHGTTMTIKSLTSETRWAYTILYAIHPPNVTWETESSIARQYGQVFLENTNHWK